MAGNEVKIKINGDASGFKKTLSGLGSVAKSSLGAIVTGAGAAATAIGAVSVKALTLAGDLEQNVGGAEAVFGELGNSISKMSAPMQKYNSETKQVEKSTATLAEVSKQAYQTMGLSQSDYLATVNKMGSLMKGSGMETQQALNLSADAMQRAADVASIMGVDIEWAMESIAGAAKGNFTMMDNLGVAMNNTTLAAYALSKGIKKPFEKMSQSQKISLAMQMFMEKTAYATGNYAKENETLAGSLATAKAAMSNFLAGAGDFDAVFESVGQVAKVSGRMIDEIITRLTDELTSNSDRIGNALGTAFSEGAKKAPKLIDAGFSIVKSLLDSLTDNADAIGSGVQQTVFSALDGLSLSLPSFTEASVALINGLIPDDPSQLTNSIVTFVDSAVASASTLLTDVDWDRLGGTITGSISAAIINSAPDLLNILSGTLSPDVLADNAEFYEAFTAAFDSINWNELGKKYMDSFINGFKSSAAGLGVATVTEAVSSMFSKAKSIDVSEFLSNIKNKLSEKINSTNWNELGNSIGEKIQDSIINKLDNVKDIGEKIIDSIAGGIKSPEEIVRAVGDVVSDAIEGAKNKALQAKEIGANIISNISASISAGQDIVAKVGDVIQDAVSSGIAFASKAVDIGVQFITGVINGILPGSAQIASNVSSTIDSAIASAKSAASKAVEIGKALIDGIIKGIKEKASKAVQAAKDVVSSIIKGGNDEGEIKSPSRKTTKSGEFMAEGYAVGLRKGTKGAVKASVDLINKSLTAMRDTAEIHSPGRKGIEIGYYQGAGVAVGELNSIPLIIAASKKLAKASLDAIGDTIKSGVEPLNKIVESAAKDIINLVPSPNAGVTNFVTEQLFGGDPIEQAKYFAKSDTKSALDAYAEAQKNELKKYEAARKEGNYSEILWYQLEENMFPKTDDGVMAFFDQRIDILETMLDMEVITEQTYYERLQQYMGEYLVNGTEQWYEYTLKMMEHKSDLATQAMEDNVDTAERFAEFEQDVLDSAHDLTLFEEMDFYRERMKRYEGYIQDVLANTEMMEKDKKELIEDYESQITDDLYAYAEKYVDAYSEAAEKIRDKEQELTDDIIAARDNMMGNLADYGTLFFQYELPEINIGGIKHKPVITELSDIGKTNETKRKYKEMLDQVMAREGFAEGFFSELEGLSIADGIDFMGALLSASDTGFKNFMSAWAEGKALDKSISESFYDPSSVQNNPELQEFRDAFTQEFGDLPDEFLTLGNQSADSFGNGLLGKITEIVNRAKNMVTSTFGNVLSPAFAMATEGVTSSVSYVSNYYLQASKYESMREQVKILRDADTLKKASGGY